MPLAPRNNHAPEDASEGKWERRLMSDALEDGWTLDGLDPDGRPVRVTIGDTQLAKAYPGVDLGRDPALCPFVLQHQSVSHRHARLFRTGEGLGIEDLNSLNGTFVDGRKLEPFDLTRLRPGMVVELGALAFRLLRISDGEARAR